MRLFPKQSYVRLGLSVLVILTLGILVLTPVLAHDRTATSQVDRKVILVADDATATPTFTPTPLPGGNTIIIIEGPVSAININIITIYNFTVAIAPDNPILTVINIGDIVHVEGEQDGAGVIVATVVTLTTATVSLNGQVTAIDGNIVVVNGTSVQFESDDATLTLINIGDILNVEGNYQGSGTTLIFIVINVTIVNNIIINTHLPANCKISKNGHIKCSKKHH